MPAVIVMYHYVRDDQGLHAFSPKRFREQLRWLADRYRFVGLDEVLEESDEPRCTLTFDDGLGDGYRNALPIMDEAGAKGAFFVSTAVLKERRVIPTQKRALLLSRIGPDAVIDAYNRRVPAHYRINEGRTMDEYNEPRVSQLKYLLDHMEFDLSDRVIDGIFAEHFDEDAVFDDLYLTADELLDLDRRGHVVGSHGHAHRWLGNLYADDQKRDLEMSVDILTSLLGHHPRWITYPFGSRNPLTLLLVAHLGFSGGLLDPTSATPKPNRFELNRYDCVDVGGEALPDPLARRTKAV
jgi:peptidoglycan/xylan/chitin deacetylase (PgdA/CDA1 family)